MPPGRRHRRTAGATALAVALAALAVLAPSASAAIPAGNLTANPSFEIDAAGWGAYNGSVTRVPNQLDAPDGLAVAQVTAAPGSDDYTLDDDTDAVASASGGRTYTASAYVKAGPSSLAKSVSLVVRQRVADDTTSTCAASNPVRLGSTYARITVSCVAAHSGDRLDVYIARQGDVASGESFYADAITLVAPPQAGVPAGNLTANPSFEAGTGDWTGYQASIAAITPADGDAPVGTKVARVTADGGTDGSYSIDDEPDTVPTAAGAHAYRASAWVRGTSTSDGRTVQLVVRETNAAGTERVQQHSAEVTLTEDGFRRIDLTVVAQATGDSIDLYVARTGDATAGESFLVDAISLTRTAPATIPAGNLTTNPSFADDATGWTSYQGHVTRVAGQDDAPDGTTVGKVVADATRATDGFTVDDDEPTVASSRTGRTYAASAWVKAASPGTSGGPARNASLIVRETDGDGDEVARAQSEPVDLAGDRYQQLTVDYAAKDAGNAIDVYVARDGGVTTGEAFYVDAITLTDTPIASVFGASETLRPDLPQPPDGTPDATVAAAANESASFQVDLRTTGVPVTGLDATMAGALSGPGGATIPASAVSLSREAYYDVRQETDGEGAKGRWPDELVPDRDPLLGGDGGAFPLDLGAHDAATIWVDVAVPQGAAAGAYTGSLRVRHAGGTTLVDVPIHLTVRPFALPSTSSLRSIFLVNPFDVCGARAGHDGGYTDIAGSGGCDPAKEDAWRVFGRFAMLGLRDRISIANPYPTPQMRAPTDAPVVPDPARPGAPTTAAAAFDAYVKPLLDGTGAQGTLPGATLTALTTQWNCIRDPGAGRDCLADWKTFLDGHASAAESRFLPWVCDEPFFADSVHQTPWGYLVGGASTPGQAPCEGLRGAARSGWPGVPTKITTAIDDPGLYADQDVDPPALDSSATDVLAPTVTDMVTRAGGSTRDRYDSFLGHPGTSLWLYVACSTGGCDPGVTDPGVVRDPEYDGWPSYSIDQPGSQASAMGWMAFLYDVTGESYFDTASGFGEGPGFQHGIDAFGSNGDGQLFYPGRVQVSGPSGTTTEDMPFESIRLKRIREGREDYEYLHLLETCGRRDDAMDVAEGLYGDLDHAMFQTTVSQAQLDAARQDLADLIVEHGCG